MSRRFPRFELRDDAPAACGIGFLASRQGVAERALVETAIELCRQFDHRGAPGHGAGFLLDIPWALLLDRFPEHARAIAQRDVGLGMFFLPFESRARRRAVERVEDLAALGGADVLGWSDVPFNLEALPAGSAARRTAPVVRQALLRRPPGLSEEGWFLCRYLLRLALDEELFGDSRGEFSVSSLSNRTVVYRGLAQLSRISELYPDLRDEHFASRFVLFHSRYSTNTTTSWRRAQPFWGLAHNGEISTMRGNVAWMRAIGRDLVARIAERQPRLKHLAARVRSVVCGGGSDSANLDDMMLALVAGGLTMPQALVALLPEAPSMARGEPHLAQFHEALGVLLGACDGPAAIVACDGDEAVAHLDRNGLRPLWIATSRDYALAASELTGTVDLGPLEEQRILGPGDTVMVRLGNGEVLQTEDVHRLLARQRYPAPKDRRVGRAAEAPPLPTGDSLARLELAFGMTREDLDVVLRPLVDKGKLAVGAMGDDTPPAALLDQKPRRMEDYFQLRFAQETSPPIDPIRDLWVFETSVALGDRSGLWNDAQGPHYVFPERLLSTGELAWLAAQERVIRLDAVFPAALGPDGLEGALEEATSQALELARAGGVLILSDRGVDERSAPLPLVRLVSRLHEAIVHVGARHRVGLVADAGVWDVHHCALLLALGADAVCPWLGCAVASEREATYLRGLRTGLVEVMSMMGVTPASAYCGARLVEAVGLDADLAAADFPGVAVHLGGIGADVLDREWLAFHARAFADTPQLPDVGEFHFRRDGRAHFWSPETVRALHAVSGFGRGRSRRARRVSPAEHAAAAARLRALVDQRAPITVLDLLRPHEATPIALDEVEPEEAILWRFFAPGMSEGALSAPAHRAVARAMNLAWRFCRRRLRALGLDLPPGLGPFANSGEGGFDKARMGGPDENRSVQYAGGRFTITPETAARAAEAEVKFAQGAKPGKGGQLPGGKVSPRIAAQRGCSPGYELVSPPVNHNLYSIEDVKLMLESWRHLNPAVACALKFVATHGVEMVCLGGVNAGANRLHLSDGCGGTGAAKRVDQKHAGVPAAAVLPTVHDALVEEGVRERVELSVDGGVQTGEQALKLFLLGADRIGFGTSILVALGCSMLRQCHLAGPAPHDPTGAHRQGCTFGVATQDPLLVARFAGRPRQVVDYLLTVAAEVRTGLARLGARQVADVVGRRDLLRRRDDLVGKAARIDVSHLVGAPPARSTERHLERQRELHAPPPRVREDEAAERAIAGEMVEVTQRLTNSDRCVGVAAAGVIARRFGDAGLPLGRLTLRHRGAAGHFYGAYALSGMELRLQGVAADSCFTAAYGGKLVIVPETGFAAQSELTLVGNTFAYGARAGQAFIAGRAGNRFAVCLRSSHEGPGPRLVVEGVLANAFQYMTGGTALVLGPTGFNLGAGLTGGTVYLLDPDLAMLNRQYVVASPLDDADVGIVEALLHDHRNETSSPVAERLLRSFDRERFCRVTTGLAPEPLL